MEQNTLNGLTLALSAGALACSGGVTTHATTATINYVLRGKFMAAKTAITGGTTPTTDAVSGNPIQLLANRGRAVVWCLDSAGAVKVVAGPAIDYLNGAFPVPPQFPEIPDDLVPFAYQVLKAASNASLVTFGTTNWNATGFTNSTQDILCLPDRPQTA